LCTDALQAIDACAGWNSCLAARRSTQFLECSGLTIAQFGLMVQIAAASDDTLGSLAERLGFDLSSLSRNLHALEREGLVEIAVVEHDLRKRAGGSAKMERGALKRQCRSGGPCTRHWLRFSSRGLPSAWRTHRKR
jgi:DNA-binding transcriptional ArsR family regulator